jgi:hypothetical protein
MSVDPISDAEEIANAIDRLTAAVDRLREVFEEAVKKAEE